MQFASSAAAAAAAAPGDPHCPTLQQASEIDPWAQGLRGPSFSQTYRQTRNRYPRPWDDDDLNAIEPFIHPTANTEVARKHTTPTPADKAGLGRKRNRDVELTNRVYQRKRMCQTCSGICTEPPGMGKKKCETFRYQSHGEYRSTWQSKYVVESDKKQKDGPDEGRTRDLGVISTTL